MKMNKLIGCSVIALSMTSSLAFATCTPSSATGSVTPTSVNGRGGCLGVPTGNFIDQAFPYQMSNNVGANTAQSLTAFFVHTAHKKGMYSYGGSSNGGSVTACESAAQSGFPSVAAPSTGGNGCS